MNESCRLMNLLTWHKLINGVPMLWNWLDKLWLNQLLILKKQVYFQIVKVDWNSYYFCLCRPSNKLNNKMSCSITPKCIHLPDILLKQKHLLHVMIFLKSSQCSNLRLSNQNILKLHRKLKLVYNLKLIKIINII